MNALELIGLGLTYVLTFAVGAVFGAIGLVKLAWSGHIAIEFKRRPEIVQP